MEVLMKKSEEWMSVERECVDGKDCNRQTGYVKNKSCMC